MLKKKNKNGIEWEKAKTRIQRDSVYCRNFKQIHICYIWANSKLTVGLICLFSKCLDRFTIHLGHGIFNLFNPPKSSNLFHPTPSHMDMILIFKHVEWVRLLKQWVGLGGGRDMEQGQHDAATKVTHGMF